MSYPPNGNGAVPRRTARAQPTESGRVPLPPHPQPPPGPNDASGPVQQGSFAQPPAPPPVEVLERRFEMLVAQNQARFAELAAKGIAPDPLYLVHARINHLIEQISAATGPNGPRWAVMTRLGFEQQIAAELAQADSVTARMQLAEGGRYTPAMIAQLAKATGTFRQPQ